MVVAPARGRADGHEHRRSDETELATSSSEMIRTHKKCVLAQKRQHARLFQPGPSIRLRSGNLLTTASSCKGDKAGASGQKTWDAGTHNRPWYRHGYDCCGERSKR
jgi:hypothetical protein